MSFSDMNKEELIGVAKMYGTDVKQQMSKAAIIKEIEADGVTYEDYKAFLAVAEDTEDDLAVGAPEPEVEETESQDKANLIKMTRTNFTYQIRGYQFTRQHPFALVSDDDAEYLVEVVGGFRPATPKELSSFYGKE